MPARVLLSLSIVVAAVAAAVGASWLLFAEPAAPAAQGPAIDASLPAPAGRSSAPELASDRAPARTSARERALAPSPVLTDAPTAPPLPPVEALPEGEGCSVSDRVGELLDDLRVLHWSVSGPATRRLEARRLERFVLDAVGCGQVEATLAALRAELDARSRAASGDPSDESFDELSDELSDELFDDRIGPRLLMVLVALGADEELPARWAALGPGEGADVLLALAWDPLLAGRGEPLETVAVDPFVSGDALLPLRLGRTPAAALRPWLMELLLGEPRAERAVRDAAAIVLGVAAADWPDAPDALVEAITRDPRDCRVPLFMLLRDQGLHAQDCIAKLRLRYGGLRGVASDDLEGHEHFALELAEVEAVVRGELWPGVPALAQALRSGDPAARLAAACTAFAGLVGGGLEPAARAELSDGLCAALTASTDPDTAWTALLALARLHVHERYHPQLSIGYDTDEPFDLSRANARTEVFLRHLADEQPAQRRLAVMGLFGAADGEEVRAALASALEAERDSGVANWIRLALVRL